MEYANYHSLEKLIQMKLKVRKKKLKKKVKQKNRTHSPDENVEETEEHLFFYEDDIWRCLIQCLLALDYVHRRYVMHRDIKPPNIVLCAPKLEDDD